MAKQLDLEDGGTITRAWGVDGYFWEIHDNQGRRLSLFRMTEGEKARLAGLILSTMERPSVFIDEETVISNLVVTYQQS